MTITAISAQKTNPDRVNVFIDGKYEFSLTLDQLLSEKIKKGIELSESDIINLKKISADGLLRSKALDWLLIRPRSMLELRLYLKKKNATPELTDSICEEFQSKGYQNDEAFAKWWIEGRIRKNKSNISIYSELVSKGLDKDLINSLLSQSHPQSSRLKELIIQKNLINKYPNIVQLKKYLVGKGFRYSEIEDVLAELNEAD
jgi:regulatory protein